MRYAIYFAPRASSALWQKGCRWLGRDPVSGAELDQPVVPGMDAAAVHELTASPRRYGFHATFKPPFRLISGSDQDVFFDAVEDFAKQGKPFQLPGLKVGRLGSFLALQVEASCKDLQALAANCVREFDGFRAAETPEERVRRAEGLDARQRTYLARWGYPYVFDQWRFHMTLTNPIQDPQLSILEPFLNDWFASVLDEPAWVQDLCVYVEPEPDSHFIVAARFALEG